MNKKFDLIGHIDLQLFADGGSAGASGASAGSGAASANGTDGVKIRPSPGPKQRQGLLKTGLHFMRSSKKITKRSLMQMYRRLYVAD